MSVQSVTQFDPSQFFRLPSTDGTGSQRLDTQVGALSASNSLSGRITVTTAEGDKVTLTADLAEDFRTVTYHGAAQQGGTNVEVSGQQTEYSLSQELGLTVEGDLNEQEIKDLSKLFQKVLNIFRESFGGQDEAALAKTAKVADRLGSLSSLAGLDLSVDVERSVSVVAAQLAADTNGQAAIVPPTNSDANSTQTATPGAAPSAAAAIQSPSSGTTAPTQPTTSASSTTTPETVHMTAPAVADKPPKPLVEQVLDAVHDAKVETGKLRKYLPRLLQKVREDLQKERRSEAETERQQTPDAPAQPANAAFFTYQSNRQIFSTLSIHT